MKPEETHFYNNNDFGEAMQKSFRKSKAMPRNDNSNNGLSNNPYGHEIEIPPMVIIRGGSLNKTWSIIIFFSSIISCFMYGFFAAYRYLIPLHFQFFEIIFIIDVVFNFLTSFQDPKSRKEVYD